MLIDILEAVTRSLCKIFDLSDYFDKEPLLPAKYLRRFRKSAVASRKLSRPKSGATDFGWQASLA
jgi:hypothetical protein